MDSCCHGQEETTALLLLDHNEDSEPFPRGLWEKTCHFLFQNSVMLADIFLFSFMPLIMFNTQIFLFFINFPAATGTTCSDFVEHRSLLVYGCVVVGHVVRMSVCMLEGYMHVR